MSLFIRSRCVWSHLQRLYHSAGASSEPLRVENNEKIFELHLLHRCCCLMPLLFIGDEKISIFHRQIVCSIVLGQFRFRLNGVVHRTTGLMVIFFFEFRVYIYIYCRQWKWQSHPLRSKTFELSQSLLFIAMFLCGHGSRDVAFKVQRNNRTPSLAHRFDFPTTNCEEERKKITTADWTTHYIHQDRIFILWEHFWKLTFQIRNALHCLFHPLVYTISFNCVCVVSFL